MHSGRFDELSFSYPSVYSSSSVYKYNTNIVFINALNSYENQTKDSQCVQ